MWMDEYEKFCQEHVELLRLQRKRRASYSNSEMSASGDDTDKSENISEVMKTFKTKNEIERDDVYWERRRRNNLAAKKSRDAKRNRELDNHGKAALLESENSKLREELVILRKEKARLKEILHEAGSSLSNCLINLTSSIVKMNQK